MGYAFSGSAQSLNTGNISQTGEPFTLSAWVKPDRDTAGEEVLNVSVTTGTLFAMNLAGNNVGNEVKAYKGSSGAFPEALSTAGFNTTDIQHICAVFGSTTSRAAYLNGANKGTNSTSRATGAGTFRIDLAACRGASSFDGNLFEAAVWAAELTDAEVASLAKGFKPHRIRPQSLIFYAPLIRAVQDYKGLTITTNGSPSVVNHARVY